MNTYFSITSKRVMSAIMVISLSLIFVFPITQTYYVAQAFIQDEWEEISPEDNTSGFYRAIAVAGDYVFAGTTAGLYISTDGGLTWILAGGALGSASITSIAIDLNPSMDGYSVSDSSVVFVGTASGLYVGMVGGSTWMLVSSEWTNSTINDIEIDQIGMFQDSGEIYAANSSGVWRSLDGGLNWILKSEGLGGKTVKKIVSAYDEGVIYALTTDNGLYKSPLFSVSGIDENWTLVRAGDVVISEIDVSRSLGVISWLAGASGVLKGNEAGDVWIAKNGGLDSSIATSIVSDYTDPSLVYVVAGGKIYRTLNEAGASPEWHSIQGNLVDTGITKTAVNPTNSLYIYSISEDGVYRMVLSDTYAEISEESVDLNAPAVSEFEVESPSDSLTVEILSFLASDENGSVSYLITETADTPATDDAGWLAWPWEDYTFASSGNRTLYAWARDTTGNISTAVLADILVDNLPPAIPSGFATTSVTWASVALGWQSSEDNLSSVFYELFKDSTDLPFATTSVTSYTDSEVIDDTEYVYYIRAVDALGNTSNLSDTLNVTTLAIGEGDAIPPTVSVTSPASGATVSGTVTISADASSGEDIESVVFKIDDLEISTDSLFPYTTSYNTASVADGNHTLTAIAYDVLGNSASFSITITIDNVPATPPAPPASGGGGGGGGGGGYFVPYTPPEVVITPALSATSSTTTAPIPIVIQPVAPSVANVTQEFSKFTKPLYVGLSNPQVLMLQNLLIRLGYLSSDSNTGYYGPLTLKAVQKFQAAEGVVSSGTPETTGFGLVGSRTREKLNAVVARFSSSYAGSSPSGPVGTSSVNNLDAVARAAVVTALEQQILGLQALLADLLSQMVTLLSKR